MMSNWARVLSALIFGASIVCATWVHAVHSRPQEARYFISNQLTTAMLLDRKTGKTWVYRDKSRGSTYGWEPIAPHISR
jgi:hypothetical protein